MLADHFDEPPTRRSQGRGVRGRGQAAVRRRARADAAADRRRQAADRLRRAASDLPLHRQEDARPRPFSGHLPRQPSRRRRQGVRLHRRLQGPLQEARERDHRLHRRGASTATTRRTLPVFLRTACDKAREDLDEALERDPRSSASRSSRRRTRCSTCATSAPRTRPTRGAQGQRAEARRALQGVTALLRAYARFANEMDGGRLLGSRGQRDQGRGRALREVRQEVKLGAGEDIDFKAYEPDMRHLLDTYIRARARRRCPLARTVLVAADRSARGSRGGRRPTGGHPEADKEATAETIENNIRKVIIDETADQPEVLRQDVGTARRPDRAARARRPSTTRSISQELEDLAEKVVDSGQGHSYPAGIQTAGAARSSTTTSTGRGRPGARARRRDSGRADGQLARQSDEGAQIRNAIRNALGSSPSAETMLFLIWSGSRMSTELSGHSRRRPRCGCRPQGDQEPARRRLPAVWTGPCRRARVAG